MHYEQPPTKQLKIWINALYSGKYEQTFAALQDSYGYCCLGVACRVLIPEQKLLLFEDFIEGTEPKEQKNAPLWLMDIDEDFKIKTGISLMVLNDEGISVYIPNPLRQNALDSFTFEEIADLLQAVYIHKVLEP